ncbi:hypothetical protein Tco_0937911 [Tanacetum coccineum]|uniref:Uncharacterized protein n=1 Tax=Tanacetum coccineum TaxID=301880 RepID=A0ABQ5DFM1_9ASTR
MPPKRTTTPMTDAAVKELIAQGIATALAEYEANRSRGNGDDSHDSGKQILLIFLPVSQDILIRASRLKKVMADKGKKSSMEIFTPNDKGDYYFRIASITVNGKNAYELKGKFLDDLQQCF